MKGSVAIFFRIFVVILFSIIIGSCYAANVYAFHSGKDVHRNFKVEKGGKLKMKLKAGGSISITGWDKDEVEVKASIGGRDWQDCNVDFNQTSSGVEIISEYKDDLGSHSGSSHFDVMVPNKFNLRLETMGGKIDVHYVNGDLNGKTMGGRMDLSNLKGHVDFSIMGGQISLTDSEVDGKVSTMGGNILIENVKGNVAGSTIGGKVITRNVTHTPSRSSDSD